jgi:hypothetical protein
MLLHWCKVLVIFSLVESEYLNWECHKDIQYPAFAQLCLPKSKSSLRDLNERSKFCVALLKSALAKGWIGAPTSAVALQNNEARNTSVGNIIGISY